jgi:MFS transporter, SP family, arabinose:H+ symporter
MTLSRVLIKSTIVAALGGLLFGFDTAVIPGITGALTTAYALSPSGLGLTVASALSRLAALLPGTATRWYCSDSSVALGIGSSSVLGPMYIAEIAPARWRGRLVDFFQFNLVAGILLAELSNYLIGLAGFGADEWRWKLGVSAAPAALFLIMLYVISRSPRWLVSKGRIEDARNVLLRIGEDDVEGELSRMIGSVDVNQSEHAAPLFRARYKLPIFLAVMFNQLSGINAILYYLKDISPKPASPKSRATSRPSPSAPPTCFSPRWQCPSSIAQAASWCLSLGPLAPRHVSAE